MKRPPPLVGIVLSLSIVLILNFAMASISDYPEAIWDPALSSNFTESEREANGLEIKWIVIHDIEGNAQAAINWFKDPQAKACSHYVVEYDGKVYQMVKEKDIAWHAGNWAYNQHSIGIEHAGYADQKLFKEEEYRASAKLVAYLVRRYNISLSHPNGLAPADPAQGSGIIGHDQVPDPSNASVGGGKSHHYDPGKNWDWAHYMELVKYYYEGPSGNPPPAKPEENWLLGPLLSLPFPLLVSIASVIFFLLLILVIMARLKPTSARHVGSGIRTGFERSFVQLTRSGLVA